MKKSFQALVFAKTRAQASFQNNLGHLAAIAPDEFLNYYNKNWGKPDQVKHWAYFKTILKTYKFRKYNKQ